MSQLGWMQKCKKYGFGAYLFITSYYLVRDNLLEIIWTDGYSMEPAIKPHQFLLTEHVTVQRFRVRRGDIVITKSPNNPNEFLCKRIVGLEGDSVSNNSIVPKGHVWLEGDNKNISVDSRSFGAVPYGLLVSRVLCILWPIHYMKNLTTPNALFRSDKPH